MSEQTQTTIPQNSLIEDDLVDTVHCCCAVLRYVGTADVEGLDEKAIWGPTMVILAVEDALRYAAERERSPGSIDKEAQK